MMYGKVYHRPQSLKDALALLDRPGISVLAGGTYLVPRIQENKIEELMDIQSLGLKKLEKKGERLFLGAMLTLQNIFKDTWVPAILKQCAFYETTEIMRNQATLGGTIVVGSTESEVLACLLALDAQIIMTNALGEKTIPLSSFLENPSSYKGIIIEVSILTQGSMGHERVCRTLHDRPIVAVVGRKDKEGKSFLAFCGIGKIPMLLEKNDLASCHAIEDFRGSSEYRKSLAKILSERITSQWEKSNAN